MIDRFRNFPSWQIYGLAKSLALGSYQIKQANQIPYRRVGCAHQKTLISSDKGGHSPPYSTGDLRCLWANQLINLPANELKN